MQIDGSAVKAVVMQHNCTLFAYQRQINQIVAGKLREVRATRAGGDAKGQPSGPAGDRGCRALVAIKSDGTVDCAELAGHASPEPGIAEMEVIGSASPFPPLGAAANVTVQTLRLW